MLAIALLVWIACAFATRAVALRKGKEGHSLDTWTLLGALFGVFALIAIALAPDPSPADRERDAIAAGEMKRCGACAELIRREATKCRYCAEAQPT